MDSQKIGFAFQAARNFYFLCAMILFHRVASLAAQAGFLFQLNQKIIHFVFQF